MLREPRDVRQVPGEPRRRWFRDEMFDLIVWCEQDGQVHGFQLCYSDGADQRALTWLRGKGFTHKRVDDGEYRRPKMTPILVPDGVFDRDRILALFEQHSGKIDQEVAEFVTRVLKEYPSFPKGQRK